MMLILVTGATGEVGRRFVPRLLQRIAPGDTVRVIVRDEERGTPFAALGARSSSVTCGTRRTYGRRWPERTRW